MSPDPAIALQAQAATEGGGNLYPKYATRNPIARRLMQGFLSDFQELARKTGARTVLEVGCGEGHLSSLLAAEGRVVRAVDISPSVIHLARHLHGQDNPSLQFDVADVDMLDPVRDRADLVVCCEVMEHLLDPAEAFDRLVRLASPYLLVSVPREPLWRILNMLRGRYLPTLGNTPGHIQHWSRGAFLSFLGARAEIVEARSPLPWIMALCRTS